MKDFTQLIELKNKNDLVFNCALTQLLTDGYNTVQKYDLDKIREELNSAPDGHISRDLQFEIFRYAKTITSLVTQWELYTFFKIYVSVPNVVDAEEYRRHLAEAIEIWRGESVCCYDDSAWESHVCDMLALDEEEYRSIFEARR